MNAQSHLFNSNQKKVNYKKLKNIKKKRNNVVKMNDNKKNNTFNKTLVKRNKMSMYLKVIML